MRSNQHHEYNGINSCQLTWTKAPFDDVADCDQVVYWVIRILISNDQEDEDRKRPSKCYKETDNLRNNT